MRTNILPIRAVPQATSASLTVREVARRYRVGEDKVRAWIARRELRAINTSAALSGRPRWIIPVDALAEFEQRRAGGSPPKAPRQQRRTGATDFYPD